MQMVGKVALVTGAGSGIGRATAIAFARRGAAVVAADFHEAAAAETVGLISGATACADTTCADTVEPLALRTDVTDALQVGRMIERTVTTYGRLDYAVNNAGSGGPLVDIAESSEAEWHRLIAVNLTGVYLCLKHEIPQMLRTGGGVIVNVASIMGQVGMRGNAAYVASKHGVVGLTKVAALEYGNRGIRVSAVCPGFVTTPLLAQGGLIEGTPEFRAAGDLHALGRMGRPEEVASAIVWLCSDDASFVSGAPFLVDGGYTAQ